MNSDNSKIGKARKIIGFWALSQLHYRQPKGEEAGERLRKLIGTATCTAIYQITGLCMDAGIFKNKKMLKELASVIK